MLAVHDEILQAARQNCEASRSRRFTMRDIVRALPHLNEQTVRTHVASRCCVNAPKNHPHRWDYFRRIAHGTYEITPKYRGKTTIAPVALRDSLHVTVSRSEGKYTAECLELPVVTEGNDLNELVHNLREALLLHLEDEDLTLLGLAPRLRLVVTAEFPLAVSA